MVTPTTKYVWLYLAVGWIVLLLLLACTIGAAYAALGESSLLLNLFIAGICIGLIAIMFMTLARSSALVRLASEAGIFGLLFMFIIAATDYLTR